MDFDRQDLKKLVYFLWKDNLNSLAIANKINTVLGESTITARNVQNLLTKFKSGDFNADDAERCGRPKKVVDLKVQIETCLTNDKYATTRSMGEQLDVSYQTIMRHLHEMGKKYLVNRWLPHKLTEENKANRERICSELLTMHDQSSFLHQIITVDEVWLMWDNGGTSYHNRSWFGAGDQPTTSIRSTLTPRKNLATIFWDKKGIILFDVLPRNTSITSEIYCAQLDKLAIAVQNKRRRTLDNLLLLQDNARPHTAAATRDKLQQLRLKALPHPPYSPDLSPSDYYLFSPMKNSVRRNDYENINDLVTDIQSWFDSKPQSFYAEGIQQLPNRWKQCIECAGDYFQHLNNND